MRFHRRCFLRSLGAFVALPMLDSLGRGHAAEATGSSPMPPKRLVFLGFGFGVTNETWFPDVNRVGADYVLPPGLAPLARHQRDLTVVQGCANRFSDEAHWGSTFWLSGANRYKEPGKSFDNSISADQVAAAALGAGTRFSSIQLGSGDAESSGHGPGLSLAWDHRGKPIAGFNTPLIAFHRLFSEDKVPLAQRQAMLAQKRSVLDAVCADAKHLQRTLCQSDTEKLDEYFQSVRDIELRLAKEERWLDKPAPRAPFDEPCEGLVGREEIKLMYDIMVAAMQTDTSRVLTYRQPVATLLSSLGIRVAAHDMTHYGPGDRMVASQRRDECQSELLAYFIDKLKATKEVDGKSLFDHICIVYGSNIRTVHYLDNCPTIITGRGAGIRLGENMVLPKNTPLCNVWLTILNGIGVPTKSHGDSTGIVKELVS